MSKAITPQTPERLHKQTEGMTIKEKLEHLQGLFPGQITFSSSFGAEDQVITDMLFQDKHNVSIFTLDTGRMFQETYKTLQKTNEHYHTPIKVYFPWAEDVEKLVSEKGPYSFYESIENRKACCFIRKVKPLKRALAGHKIWITGLRADQSPERADTAEFEWDSGNEMVKYNPLYAWTWDEVWAYIRQHNVPYNPLHDRGFLSIGCQPCTRALKKGESFRDGRWWWEDNSKKECGLHEESAVGGNGMFKQFKTLR